jgi:two-component system KDP operon response regulator KdpE
LQGVSDLICSEDFLMNETAIRVLLVDDESAIRRALRPPLMELGFEVTEATRGEEALQILRTAAVDAVLLDINMPGIGGIETLRRIRSFAQKLPILMLTVRDAEEEKVEALNLGADDYITKPFSTRELIARIRASVRRVKEPKPAEEPPIEIGEIRLDYTRRSLTKRGKAVHLTRKEFDILHCLMGRAGRSVTNAKLLTLVWGAECIDEVQYLRTYVNLLRKKIEDDPANPLYLLTDAYAGYRFADAQLFEQMTMEGEGGHAGMGAGPGLRDSEVPLDFISAREHGPGSVVAR